MNTIQIRSHSTVTDFGGQGSHADRSVIESILGEAVVFHGEIDAIVSVTVVGGDPITSEGSTYSFSPPSVGLHQLSIVFSSGRTRLLNVIRVGEEFLNRIRIPAPTKAEFVTKARLVVRSILRHRVADAGLFPDGLNPAHFGAVSGAGGSHYAELP